jgi:hypothetical protein
MFIVRTSVHRGKVLSLARNIVMGFAGLLDDYESLTPQEYQSTR